MERRKTRKIKVGNIFIGGNAPVSIQGMTKIPTSYVSELLRQVGKMVKEGAELVRISILNEEDTRSIKKLKEKFSVPLIADIHYNYKLAISAIDKGIDKIRINPGNIKKSDLKKILKVAKRRNVSIRIGINSGSVKIKGSVVKSMVEVAKNTMEFFEDNDFRSIILSLKTPDVQETVECYREISELCNYPFHLGITEAGAGTMAETKSILGIGLLLSEGIGDTIRVSMTDSPQREIKIAKAILQSLHLRKFETEIISCPTCGRVQVDVKKVLRRIKGEIKKISKYNPEIVNFKIAVMGCSVNGPGEAKQADIGIAGGKKKFALFKKGNIIGSYPEELIVDKLVEEIEKTIDTENNNKSTNG